MFVTAPFYFILCVYVVHIVFSCNFHELFVSVFHSLLVVFYIVFI